MVPLSYTYNKIAPLSYTSRISQNNRISCNGHVFPEFSVVLIRLHGHFCQNVAAFDVLRYSHHLFLFAADFVTLSYTEMAIFPTLLYTARVKRYPFRAEPPRIAHYREYSPGTYHLSQRDYAPLKKAPLSGGASPYSPLLGVLHQGPWPILFLSIPLIIALECR